MKKQTSLITLSLLLATPALAGGAGAPVTRPTTAGACKSIAQIISTDPQFSTLRTAVEAAGLGQTLMTGQYTVFAPTNAAFAKLPSDTLAQVLNDPDTLGSVLLYHVVRGKVTAQQVRSLKSAKSAQGANVTISTSGSSVRINDATVTRADVPACNGIIHVIDTVLLPPAVAGTQPAAAAPAASAATAPSTPAAPASAFDVTKIPSLPLSGATVSTTETTTATGTETTGTEASSTEATGTEATGTETTTETATTETSGEMTAEDNTLYDVLVADDRFSTLRDLISDAGLTETLMSGEYTIFAPTNEAFEALPEGTLAALSASPDLLRQVLSYHVVQGRLSAEQLAAGTSLNALAGGALPLSMSGSTQMVGQATVTGSVTTASNGTIYVINQVLLPPGLTLPAAEETTTDTTGTATTGTAEAGTAGTAGTATTTTTTATGTVTTTTTTPGTAGTAGTTATTTTAPTGTLAAVIAADPRFSTLAGLIGQAGLTETLAGGEYTIFAPTNDAFAKVPAADLAAITGDPARLRAVLLYHVVQGRQTPEQLAAGTALTSAAGGSLALSMSGKMVGTANVGEAITTASNGTIYVIDTVLLPPAR